MPFRSRRAMMRPSREFNVVLHARDQQVTTLQDHNDTLRAQLDVFHRRLTNARANAHADARAYQLQERKIEQLRVKLRDVREGSAAQRRALGDVRRESEMLKVQLGEAHEENFRHQARIAELELALQQVKSPQAPTGDLDLEFEGLSHDDILDVLARVTDDLEAAARVAEEIASNEQSPIPPPRPARANTVEMGIQTTADEIPGAKQSGSSSRQLQDAEDMERRASQAQSTSGHDQRRIRELEVDLEHARRLNEELRIAVKEEHRLVQEMKASSIQEQSRVASLEDAARQDQHSIKVLEASVDKYRAEIDSLEAEVVLLRTLLEESRTFNDDLEENYNSIVACKDAFIQDLQERVEDLTTSGAWSQQREAVLQDAQERLAAVDIEVLELRLELEGAQRNAVTSTNRIIQLEAEASTTRQRLRAENGDLRDELGMASERVYALEDELVAAQGRLDNAESTIRQLYQELEQYVHRLQNGPPIQDDVDSQSDEGSIDTLVMDPDEHPQEQVLSRVKGFDSPASTNQDEEFPHDLAPSSVRALEARLETMTLKYEAAEAARVCGDDVEDMLRTKLQAFSKNNLFVDTTAPVLVKSDPDEPTDTPSEEWHSLPTIPEEDEPSTSPTVERFPPLRIQTCPRITSKRVVAGSDNVNQSTTSSAESPLLPSPTLSDIWFSNIRVSLALMETGSSVLDWDLPSPGGDSDPS